MIKVAIIGAGDLGRLIAHHISQCGNYSAVGFFDDYAEAGTFTMDIPVLGALSQTKDHFNAGKFDQLIIGIGYNHMAFRKSVFETYAGSIPFATLIHKNAFVDPSVRIGQGCFILPGCTLDAHTELGENVLLNTAAVVAHDSIIGSHSFIAPSVAIAGKTHIGECCILGINCTVIDNLRIHPFIRIGAGAVVLSNLEISGMYAGIPAQLKKIYS
jgi:sugar O-acyltransferase (sialic acid O-acetyltransferase NeuD family)